ncbi:hypothetical protein ACIBF1_16805 [Spirillospora sp. NPDC050679]
MAGLSYFPTESNEPPQPAVIARVLLWFIGGSTLVGSLSWFLDGTDARAFGAALAVATPGVAVVVLLRRYRTGRRRTWIALTVLAALYVLWQVSRILDGNFFGLVGLPVTVVALVGLVHPATRVFFQREPGEEPPPEAPRGDRGVSALQYGALLTVVAVTIGALLVVVPNEFTPSLKNVLCQVFDRDKCGTPTASEPKGPAPNTTPGTGGPNGTTGTNGNRPPQQQPPPKPKEEKKDCDWKCKLKGGLSSAGNFVKDTAVGVYEGGKDLVVGTWDSITGATCMATGVGCSEEERQKMIDGLVDQWNAFKDNPFEYTKEIAEAAIANCKNAVTGEGGGEAFGRCLVDAAGVIVAKKLPPGVKLPGSKLPDGKNDKGGDHDAGGKPDPRNDKDNDGKPDCVLTALGPPGGTPGGGTVAFGRMGAQVPIGRLLAAPCPIKDNADKADDASKRAKDAASRGNITEAEKAFREADKAYQDALDAARKAGDKDPDNNPEVKRAKQARDEADKALRDAAKTKIDGLRHDNASRPRAHGVERHLDPTDDRLKMRLGDPIYDDPPNNTRGKPLQGGPNAGYVKNQPGTKVDPARSNPYNPDGSKNTSDAYNTDSQGNPSPHQAGPFSTAFGDPVDMAIADEIARTRLASMTPGSNGQYPEIKISINDLPPDAAKRMRGYYRQVNDPDNPKAINFDNAEIVCRYSVDANGKPYMATMYPEPDKSKNPP